jgi:hypothetical protein
MKLKLTYCTHQFPENQTIPFLTQMTILIVNYALVKPSELYTHSSQHVTRHPLATQVLCREVQRAIPK